MIFEKSTKNSQSKKKEEFKIKHQLLRVTQIESFIFISFRRKKLL